MAVKQYNLLIITPDQMRADYLGCYGHPSIGTTHIDRLAAEGVAFKNCYCAAPLCGPSRISFATSTYFSEHNHRNYGSTIGIEVPNIVGELKKNGYRTGMFGKNHLFTYEKLGQLWDEYDEICLGNCDNHPDYKKSFSSFTLDPKHPYNITGRLTDETIGFMKKSNQPFLAWVNYQDPHPAFCCPPPYDTMFDPKEVKLPPSYYEYDKDSEPVRNEVWRQHSEMYTADESDIRKAIAIYMGQIKYVDDCVGRMLKFLNETGRIDNTVILFFSDHGELLGDRNMTHKLPAFYDCLTRIPAIIRHPEGKWKGVKFNGLVEEVDLVPTLLSIMNIEQPPTMIGKSLKEILDEGGDIGKETVLCEAGICAPTLKEPIKGLKLKAPHAPTSYGPGAMIRKGEWKLSIYSDDVCELYNIAKDVNEIDNLYEKPEFKHVRDELTLLLLKRLLSVKVRDVKGGWPTAKYKIDVREAPLEQ